MNDTCRKCEAGPSDASGHDDLFTESFHGGNLMLKCRTCGSFWLRKTTPDAGFTWTRSPSSQGALTP